MNIYEAKNQLKQWAEQIGHGANPFRDVLAAVNAHVIDIESRLATETEIRQAEERNIKTLIDWMQGRGDGWPLSGHHYSVRMEAEKMQMHLNEIIAIANHDPDNLIATVDRITALYPQNGHVGGIN